MRFLTFIPALFALPTIGALIDKQYAHLIVPLNKSEEYTPMGTQKSFDIERYVHHPYTHESIPNYPYLPQIWTAFLFDVPDNNANWCNLKLTISTDEKRGAPYKV